MPPIKSHPFLWIHSSHTQKTSISVTSCCIENHSKIQLLKTTVILLFPTSLGVHWAKWHCFFALSGIGFGCIIRVLHCAGQPRWPVHMAGLWCWLVAGSPLRLSIETSICAPYMGLGLCTAWWLSPKKCSRVRNPRGRK